MEMTGNPWGHLRTTHLCRFWRSAHLPMVRGSFILMLSIATLDDRRVFSVAILTLQPTSQPATKAAGLDLHQLVIVLLGMPALALGTASIVYKKWPYYSLDYTLSWHGVSISQHNRAPDTLKLT